ncbi:hypothetical protein F2Q70_00026418 [Brassica cretica]|uniref:Uncharacterized protein n=1 Tax=Brassica cretica TaxID=69181 RepID=A0A8S9L7P2_BRACR|nr:hypothetical protein F2Q70_00026418 [Brassica cretica]
MDPITTGAFILQSGSTCRESRYPSEGTESKILRERESDFGDEKGDERISISAVFSGSRDGLGGGSSGSFTSDQASEGVMGFCSTRETSSEEI